MFRYVFLLIVLILSSSVMLPCLPSHAAEFCPSETQVTIIGRSNSVDRAKGVGGFWEGTAKAGDFRIAVRDTSPCPQIMVVVIAFAPPKECDTYHWFIASGKIELDSPWILVADNISCHPDKPPESLIPKAAAPSESRRTEASRETSVTHDQGHWFVVAGAWPQSESYKVKARVALLSGNNIAAKVINTDQYANLTPGLRAVVLGPTSREQAEVQLATIKSIVPDAYIKEGF